MIKAKAALVLTALLATTLFPSTAHARDLAIWDQLQGTNPKGYVLLMRHALAPGVGDPENFNVNDCSTQRNLSDEGRKDAREIGSWLKRRDIKIFRVESSRWCRAKETAQLLDLGKVRPNKNFDSLFRDPDPAKSPQTTAIKKRIFNHRNTRGILVLVGHAVNIQTLSGTFVDSGEGVLVRATAQGELKVLGYSPAP
jgi:phosphohistidine phosphatase SixA